MASHMHFKFKGFRPDDQIRKFVSTVAERLYFSAPSDSTMKLVVEQGKSAVRASCRIASQAGTFVADAMSDSPARAVQQIEGKIRDQLDGWKRRRFEDSAEETGLIRDAK